MEQNETKEAAKKEKGDGSESDVSSSSRLGKVGEVVYNMTKGVISKAVQFIKPSTTTTNEHTACPEEKTNHTNTTR